MIERFTKYAAGVLFGLITTSVSALLFLKILRHDTTEALAIGHSNRAEITTLKVDVVDAVSDKMIKMQLDMMEQINKRFDEQSRRLHRIESTLEE
jgi:uncharacterized protein YgfB (UPF0149 family)